MLGAAGLGIPAAGYVAVLLLGCGREPMTPVAEKRVLGRTVAEPV